MCAVAVNTEIKKRIDANKIHIKSELASYTEHSKALKEAFRELQAKLAKHNKKRNEKTQKLLSEAQTRYDGCLSSARACNGRINELVISIEVDWGDIISVLESAAPKQAKKERAALSKYVSDVRLKRDNIESLLTEAGMDLSVMNEVAPVAYMGDGKSESQNTHNSALSDSETVATADSEADAPMPEADTLETADVAPKPLLSFPKDAPAVRASQGINLAPISIDISATVERAVNKAMDKFSAALERKINEYFKNYELKLPTVAVPGVPISTAAKESAELQAKLADDESYLLDKLKGLVEVIKGLNNSIVGISTAFSALDAKFNEIAELQNQVNDMQRHTMREQQGVQVNQRIISKEQLSVTEEQALLMDSQKNTLEEQKHLSGEQSAVVKTQQAIVETQASLEDAMKAVMDEQKRIISAQQQIISDNAKSLQLSGELADKQRGVAEGQRELIAAQKQMAKEQKGAAERMEEIVSMQKATLDDLKELQKEQKSSSAKVAKAKTPKPESANS